MSTTTQTHLMTLQEFMNIDDEPGRTVEVISSTGERRTIHENDELVDEIIPGFRVKVAEIFE